MQIADYLEYALLHPSTSERNIIDLCADAQTHNYKFINIHTSYLTLAKQLLKNTNIKICTPVGFPLGATTSKLKFTKLKKRYSLALMRLIW